MMVLSKPYQWPGGMFHEIPPLSGEETDQLYLTLGVSSDHRAKLRKAINIAFLQLFDRVSRQSNGISHARGEKQAERLLHLVGSPAGTDDYFATAALAKRLGYSPDELGAHVRATRHSLINSSSDLRENRPLSNFCCHIICCADVCCIDDKKKVEWTLPTTENVSDETLELPKIGVLAFAELALRLGCERLRVAMTKPVQIPSRLEEAHLQIFRDTTAIASSLEEAHLQILGDTTAKADHIISDLEKTSLRSLRDTIAKWRHVTLDIAFEQRAKTADLEKI